MDQSAAATLECHSRRGGDEPHRSAALRLPAPPRAFFNVVEKVTMSSPPQHACWDRAKIRRGPGVKACVRAFPWEDDRSQSDDFQCAARGGGRQADLGSATMNFTKHFTTTARQTTAQVVGHFRFMVMLVAGLWFIEIGDQVWGRMLPGGTMESLGIHPRTVSGLIGIVVGPMVHGSYGQLANNSLPLIGLGWLVMLGGRKLFFKVSGLILLVSGVATWLFGSAPGPHLGASGLVYGYLGFLLVRGFLEPSVRWVVVSVIVGVLYTGVLGALLPSDQVSGAGQAGGFVGGVLAGWMLFFWPKWRRGRLGVPPASPGGNRPEP